jgi:hypothetical protein
MVADTDETPALPLPANQQVDAAAASTDGFVRRSTRERKPAMIPTVQYLRPGATDVSRTKSLSRKAAKKVCRQCCVGLMVCSTPIVKLLADAVLASLVLFCFLLLLASSAEQDEEEEAIDDATGPRQAGRQP